MLLSKQKVTQKTEIEALQKSEKQRGFGRSKQRCTLNFRHRGERKRERDREKKKKKSIMGGWWFKLVILGIFLRTQTYSENNKIA